MSSASSKTLETNPPVNEETLNDQSAHVSDQPKDSSNEEEVGGGKEGEDEEEGECGFCLFMKGGGCKDTFIAWENCIEEVQKNGGDIAEKCFEVTSALRKCMDAHADYYEPIFRAEKAAEEEAVKELEKESASEDKIVEKEAMTEVPQEAPSEEKQES